MYMPKRYELTQEVLARSRYHLGILQFSFPSFIGWSELILKFCCVVRARIRD